MLNARRQLDLTPRQLAQLDSMERVLWTEREKLRTQARQAPRDSLRATLRPQMQALRQRDSTARVAAERILTDAQRGKLREMQAERRGYERGRREGGMRQDPRGRRQGRMQGRVQGGQRPGGRPGGMQGGARPPQRPE
jgi:flagellar biosynthesis/type III secretory pathway protein FliH